MNLNRVYEEPYNSTDATRVSNYYATVAQSGVNTENTYTQSLTTKKKTECKKPSLSFSLLVSVLALLVAIAALALAAVFFAGTQPQPQEDVSGESTQNLIQEIQALRAHFETKINNTRESFTDSSEILQQDFENQQLELSNTTAQLSKVQQKMATQASHLKTVFCEVSKSSSFNLFAELSEPVASCREVPDNCPSDEYWIQTDSTSSPVQVYCSMNRASCSCTNMRGWMRVANLDMTDPNQNCPAGFRLVTRGDRPLRTCGRPGIAGCVSTTYQTYGVEYTHICGRIIAYQDRTPDAFDGPAITIDSHYIDGVSLTHGQSPRQHIWSFVAAAAEQVDTFYTCPCTRPGVPFGGNIPTFVGQDYFCDVCIPVHRYTCT